MSGIVCAIRGGASSQPTINQAIRTAIETNLPIYFLYVLNLDFLKKGAQSRTQTISEEMRELCCHKTLKICDQYVKIMSHMPDDILIWTALTAAPNNCVRITLESQETPLKSL